MCPANYATGGPEALHQLAHELIQQNHETFMYYVHYNQDKKNSPIHPFYKKYNIPYVFEIENDKKISYYFPRLFVHTSGIVDIPISKKSSGGEM